MSVLVVNAGSSSLKLDLVEAGGEARRSWRGPADAALPAELAVAGIEAVGHRIVHGGREFRAACRIDDGVVERLEALTPLAPLHQPRALALVRSVSALLPQVPAVAVFDTAFHAELPPAAATYAVPAEWRASGVRRFGFHGISHGYVSSVVQRRWPGGGGPLRLVSCHLGAGCSLAAIRDGHSIDTTMGFTPLEGLVMATRAGSVDPGIVQWLCEERAIPLRTVMHDLEHGSGLRGLAGTADMQAVVERAGRGDADARLALDVFAHRARAGIAAMAASLGGVDVIAFTGGIGENQPEVRARCCAGLQFLGVELDPESNAAGEPDSVISAPGTPVTVVVIRSDEAAEISRQVRAVLAAQPG